MSRKDAINSLYLGRAEPAAPSEPRKPGVRSGAISAMGVALHDMALSTKHAADLEKRLADGGSVLLLDPALIDHSGVADRILIDVDPDFDRLVDSIKEVGQQIPILVRPNPSDVGRFQVAYGRRRLRAAQALGVEVRAIVRELTDSELIIAQGRENLDRRDLSFIERAFFAKNLEESGCDRVTIVSALASDKADVSRYIAVARRMDEDIVRRIGPAPKAGRARWITLADRLERSDASIVAIRVLSEPGVLRADSDARFKALFEALGDRGRDTSAYAEVWKAPGGKRGARFEARDGKTALVFEEKVVPEFARFIAGKLDDLFDEFRASEKRSDGQ